MIAAAGRLVPRVTKAEASAAVPCPDAVLNTRRDTGGTRSIARCHRRRHRAGRRQDRDGAPPVED